MDEQFINWLLESNIPSIRYRTLIDLAGLPKSDQRVRNAWHEMRVVGPIPSILSHQTDTGGWVGENSYYTPKYRSTHWSMLLLSELGADPQDLRLQRGVDSVLNRTRQSAQRVISDHQHGWECFWGNLLRYALAFSDPGDPRLANIIRLLVVNAPEAGWRCQYNDEQPCAWGAARTLWGLAALPESLQSSECKSTIQKGIAFLLETDKLLKADYPVPAGGKIHPLWSRLNYPLFYQADILFVLRTLTELDALNHPGAKKALEWLASRRGRNGRWRGSSPYRGRTWREMGDREETDRWVSLQTAMVIERSP